VTLFLDTLQTIIKYVIHLRDARHDGVWETRGTILYYAEFVTDTAVLALTFVHYLHVMVLEGRAATLRASHRIQ
jgi:hypothetical protein